MCCGKDPRIPGCSKSPHFDDSVSSEVKKLEERRGAAQRQANAVLFESCTKYHQDSAINPVVLTSPASSSPGTAGSLAELKCSNCRMFEQILLDRQASTARDSLATGYLIHEKPLFNHKVFWAQEPPASISWTRAIRTQIQTMRTQTQQLRLPPSEAEANQDQL